MPVLTLAIALASGLGALARYVLDQAVQHRTASAFPYGILLVNVTGSLLLGLVLGLAAHQGLATGPTMVLGAGFAGGYTTLSTWAWETLAMARDGELLAATLNLVGSIALGLAAAAAGFGLALL